VAGKGRFVNERTGELWRWRHLFVHLVVREVRARYRRSLLGPLWLVVNPLVLVAVYTFVFSVVLKVPVADYPYFLLAGLLPWTWFVAALTRAVSSLARDANLVRRSPFPLEMLPLLGVVVAGCECAVGLVLLVAVLAVTGRCSCWTLPVLPLLLVVQASLTTGLALPLAAIGAVNRDVDHVVANGLRLLFFATPIAYGIEQVPESVRQVVAANPLAWLAGAYRACLLGGPVPAPAPSAVVVTVAFVVLVTGRSFFRRRAHLVPEVL